MVQNVSWVALRFAASLNPKALKLALVLWTQLGSRSVHQLSHLHLPLHLSFLQQQHNNIQKHHFITFTPSTNSVNQFQTANMSLTARDTELLALSWQCFKEPPKVSSGHLHLREAKPMHICTIYLSHMCLTLLTPSYLSSPHVLNSELRYQKIALNNELKLITIFSSTTKSLLI